LIRQQVIRRRVEQWKPLRQSFMARGVMGGVCALALSGCVAYFIALDALAVMAESLFGGQNNPDLIGKITVIVITAIWVGLLAGWRNGNEAYKGCATGESRWWKASLPSLSGITTSTGVRIGRLLLIVLLLHIYAATWCLLRLAVAPLVAASERLIRLPRAAWKRILVAGFLCAAFALAVNWVRVTFLASDELLNGLAWTLLVLTFFLCIDLCAFSLAIPEGGIQAARGWAASAKELPKS
jgi:hypothetical protein